MSVRRYFIMGLLIGIVVFILGILAGPSIVSWLTLVRDQAIVAGMGVLANVIADPLIWMMGNPVFGAIAVVFVWPVLIIWLALVFIMVLVGFGADAARDTRSRF